MSAKIIKKTLSNKYFSFDAMAIIPSIDEHPETKSQWGVFTHGYTASKSDCLSWSQRFADNGAPSVFFDLPGHYMGSFHEVESFEDFKAHAHECFIEAFEFLKSATAEIYPFAECEKVIFAGHSLGALLTIKAMDLPYFDEYERLGIGVGLGISQHKNTHLFESDFYQKTLNIRRQLVSPALDSDIVFPWIKEEKLKLQTSNQRIHLITGVDDLVVGTGGMKALEEILIANENQVTSSEPKRLPHHEPALAAGYLSSFLRKELGW